MLCNDKQCWRRGWYIYILSVVWIMFLYYMARSVSGQDESNSSLWLATWAGKMELSCPLGTFCCDPHENFSKSHYNKSVTDQACSVKMAGYWPTVRSHSSVIDSLWTLHLHRVVRKLVNTNPGLKVNWGNNFSCIKVLSITYVLFSFRLLMLKTELQKI